MTHFNPSVPKEIREKLSIFADVVEGDYINQLSEGYGCTKIDEISGVPYSGFIPYTNGGFIISEFIRCDLDASYHLTNAQTEWVNKMESILIEEIRENFDIDLTVCSEPPEEVTDYENDFWEPALLQITAIVTEKHKVKIELSVTYRDSPYYRYEYREVINTIELTLAEFTQINPEELATKTITYEKK